MKESLGSLRAFFGIIGGLGVLGGSVALLGSLALMSISPLAGTLLMLWVTFNMVLSMAYLYCGIKLPTLLDTRVNFVIKVIMVNLGMNLLSLAVAAMLGGLTAQTLGQTAFSFLISFYLLNSVKRLKAERANRPEADENQPGFSRF